MKSAEKAWLIAALVLIIVGILLSTAAFAAMGFDFHRLSTDDFETVTYPVTDSFERISIVETTAAITFAPSPDGSCTVLCREEQPHLVTVEDRTLLIRFDDTRKWYDHIGVSFESPEVTIYLPQDIYVSLSIETTTGDVQIPETVAFDQIQITGSTSDITCCASAHTVEIRVTTGDITLHGLSADTVQLESRTGDIHVRSAKTTSRMEASVTTGEILLEDTVCGSINASATTGDICFIRTTAEGELSAETGTGDVLFDQSDAAALSIQTTTGSVTGTLRTEKVFLADSNTGSVHTPGTASGGICKILTGTGDIRIDLP